MDLFLILLLAAAGLVVLFLVLWLVILAYVKATSRHGPIERFLEPAEDDMSAEERVKTMSNHPGAGGFG